jgi:hypothetical protein
MFKRIAIVLLFALIASPFLFKTVASIAGNWVASSNSGSPTPAGLLLHGLVFVLAAGFLTRSLGGYRNYAEEAYAEEAYAEEAYADEMYAEEPYAADEAYAEEMYAEEPYEDYRN